MERVGALLENEGSITLRRRLGEARAMSCWPEIVGAGLAGRTRPLQVAGRRLFVVCHGAALRQELSYMKREIQRRFNEYAGVGKVREIVFLEADANLSPLLVEARRDEARLVVRENEGRAGGSAPPTAKAETAEQDEEKEPDYAKYPVFDGEAYRQEMSRIAKGE